MGTFSGKDRRDEFFEISPDDVDMWVRPSTIKFPKKKVNIKPFLSAFAVSLLLCAIVVVVIVLIPSSTVSVPNVVRLNLSAAMERIRKAGLEPRLEGWVNNSVHDEGTVISQRPRSGAHTKKGSTVLIVASKGPAETGEGQTFSGLSEQPGSTSGLGGFKRGKVCIDPGKQAALGSLRGDWVDPGLSRKEMPQESANGVSTGKPEHLLNLDISMRLKGLLEKDGFEVVMTRETGAVELGGIDRAEIASQSKADLFVSIQMSSSTDPKQKGCIILYPERNSWTEAIYWKSKKAALMIEEEFRKYSAITPVSLEKTGLFSIFNWSSVPVVCVRVGFMTNTHDDEILGDENYRAKVAKLIESGIVRYFSTPQRL